MFDMVMDTLIMGPRLLWLQLRLLRLLWLLRLRLRLPRLPRLP